MTVLNGFSRFSKSVYESQVTLFDCHCNIYVKYISRGGHFEISASVL